MNRAAPMNVVLRSAAPGCMFFIPAIEKTPIMDEIYPTTARAIGIMR